MAGEKKGLPAGVSVGVIVVAIGVVAVTYGRYWLEPSKSPGVVLNAPSPSASGARGAGGMSANAKPPGTRADGSSGAVRPPRNLPPPPPVSRVGQAPGPYQTGLATLIGKLATMRSGDKSPVTDDQWARIKPILATVRGAATLPEKECRLAADKIQKVLTDDQRFAMADVTPPSGLVVQGVDQDPDKLFTKGAMGALLDKLLK